MKPTNTLPLLIGGAMLAGSIAAGAFTFNQYKAAPVTKLHMPAMPDSVEKENPFSADKFLSSRKWMPYDPAVTGWTTMTTDTAGRLVLVGSKLSPELHTFDTRLRADRFAKGKLVINSTARAAVKVNGKTMVTKAAADSLPADAEGTIELLPEQVYDITVDILGMPDDKSAPDFKLEFVPDDDFKDVTVKAAPEMKSRVSALTALVGERVYSVSLSPDGKYLITRSRETIGEDETEYRAMLTETATGRVLSADISTSADWMPKGSQLYYAKKHGDSYDIVLTEIPSMRSRVIAISIPDNSVTFSPDGKYLFYYEEVEGAKETGKMKRYRTPDDRIPGDRDRSYIARYDIENRVTQPITYGGATTGICDFTRDGGKMLYYTNRQQPDRFPFYFMSLIEMDMNTLKQDTILSNTPFLAGEAKYSPDGKQLLIIGGPDAFDKIGANYAPEPIGNDFDHQAFIYDIATGKVRAMSKDFDPSIEQMMWNPADGKIYLTAEAGFYKKLYSLDPASGKYTELKTAVPYVRSFSMGDYESNCIAYAGGDFTRDGEAWLLNLKNGKNTAVSTPLTKITDGVEFGKMEPWTFKASDGKTIDGFMCLPPDFDASKKYPLIVYYYGGTSPTNATFYHLYSPQVFASRDYVVYLINPSGTTGYGQEFSARHVNAWGKRTAAEIIEGTKKFCDAHPYVDRKKIGCIGASYGGFMTQYLQTQTDIFAAAVSHAGISNVTSYWGEGYWGYSYNSVAAARSYPWTDPDLFTKQGSLFNADKIHTPLLLLHGTVDTNVPIGESIQLFNALKILGREVEFITVENENHVIAGYEARQLWQNTIMAWFAKWLQDDPKWWNELYGK